MFLAATIINFRGMMTVNDNAVPDESVHQFLICIRSEFGFALCFHTLVLGNMKINAYFSMLYNSISE